MTYLRLNDRLERLHGVAVLSDDFPVPLVVGVHHPGHHALVGSHAVRPIHSSVVAHHALALAAPVWHHHLAGVVIYGADALHEPKIIPGSAKAQLNCFRMGGFASFSKRLNDF